ncbi:MAG: DNA-binding protein [Rhodoferax sp.]|nr:DNA-binding protein [Rhodoferax sp.]
MRLTTKGRFAITAMMDLALRENRSAVTLSAISGRQQISLSYLEQMFSDLRRAGLVESIRGPGGGYTLGRKPAAISVADIILAVESHSRPARRGVGRANGQVMASDVWDKLSVNMLEYMQGISLKSLVIEQLAKGVVVEPETAKRSLFSRAKPRPFAVTAPNSVFALGKPLKLSR